MPVIPDKRATPQAFGTFLPTRRATLEDFDSTGDSARALSRAGGKIQQAGEALQVAAERDDVLTAQKSIADIRTRQTLRIQKMQEEGGPDGDIGAITSAIAAEADTALSAARSKLGTGRGKQVFDALGADLKSVLVPRAAAVQAKLVGLKAKAQYDDLLNSLGTALVSDPTQLQSALQHAEAGLANTPGLPADLRIQLAEHAQNVLTKAAVQGAINLNPWTAKSALQAGKYDATLKTEDKAALINAAETQIRARKYDAEAGAAAALRQQRLKDMNLQNDALPRIVDGTITAKEILGMDASYAAKVQLLGQMKHYSAKKGPTGDSDPDTTLDLFRRITAPPGTPDRIETQEPLNQAVLDRGISLTMRNFLANTLHARDNPADQPYGPAIIRFLGTVEPMFRTPFNLPGVSFSDRYAVFGQLAFQKVKEYAESGKNVNELFDPQHPNSLFKVLEHYKPTLQEAQKRAAEVLRAQQKAAAGIAESSSADPKGGQEMAHIERLGRKPGEIIKGRGKDGVERSYRFKGGDPKEAKNYQVAPPSEVGKPPVLPREVQPPQLPPVFGPNFIIP